MFRAKQQASKLSIKFEQQNKSRFEWKNKSDLATWAKMPLPELSLKNSFYCQQKGEELQWRNLIFHRILTMKSSYTINTNYKSKIIKRNFLTELKWQKVSFLIFRFRFKDKN